MNAYLDMNLPQPILSAKLHKNTPDELYAAMGRFFFSPSVLTPSLFNDDSVFQILAARGVKEEDLTDYAVAGCQEPLIMGKDNGNTTNSWLNMPKILELTLNGGYASHLGVDPKFFTAPTKESKGLEFARRVIRPLFFNEENKAPVAPFYLYVNVTTPDTLRKVLADPEKYAPSGVYIMPIHGTFVNFLDLSPAVQQDIIARLDLKSTIIEC